MKQFSFCVDENHSLSDCLEAFRQACPKEYSAILAFVFTAHQKANDIWEMTEEIHRQVPDASIAGCTSAGEILAGELRLRTTALSFLVFEKTRVQIFAYDFDRVHPDDAGSVLLGQCRLRPELAAVGLLGTLKSIHVRPLFSLLSQLSPEIPVFGGGANAYDPEALTYVFTQGALMKKGLLAICLESSALKVHVVSQLGWKPLGRQMEITDMFGDTIITELDHEPAISMYEKYLDIRQNDRFVHDTMAFPVILERNGHMIARLPNACTNDGSLIFSADFEIGERVWLAYGDPSEILRQSRMAQESVREFGPEGLLLFSCISRRFFLLDDMRPDLSLFRQMGLPSAGLYTYGEIDRMDRHVETLNVAMVSVALREGAKVELPEEDPLQDEGEILQDSISMVQRLTNFIAATTKELEEANEKLVRMAAEDRLTRLYNRGEVERILRHEIASPAVEVRPLSVVMLDLDGFKHINDTYGHQTGDTVLQFTAESLRKSIRSSDFAGRWGGEEFLVLLPGATAESAVGVAERIRRMMETTAVLPDGKCVTASFGVAEYMPGEKYAEFYRRLDDLLYKAKQAGRNCVMSDVRPPDEVQ